MVIVQLFAWYISMSPVPHAVYSVVGYAVRLAKDLGIHRRGTYGPRLTVEDELKKRAFWSAYMLLSSVKQESYVLVRCLVAFDRTTSDKMGRPYNVYDEESVVLRSCLRFSLKYSLASVSIFPSNVTRSTGSLTALNSYSLNRLINRLRSLRLTACYASPAYTLKLLGLW